MKSIPFVRFLDLLTLDVIPRALARLGYRRIKQPRGASRPDSEDYSLLLPFGFDTATGSKVQSVAVVCHLFHEDLAPWFFDAVCRMNIRADILISTSNLQKKIAIAAAFSGWKAGSVQIEVVPNRGRDIAPKLLAFSEAYRNYDLLLFLHGKKSVHFDFGEGWRNYLVDSLAGSPAIVSSILKMFAQCPEIGLVFPQHYSKLRRRVPITWAGNFFMSRRIAWRMGFGLVPEGYVDFPSGSMFWCRPKALGPLLDLDIKLQDFPPENGQIDMTLAHCIERLFLFACEKAGYGWIKVTTETVTDETLPATPIRSAEELSQFVSAHNFRLLDVHAVTYE